MRTTRRDALTVATVAFVATNLLHGADHIRQGTGRLTTEVLVGGTVVTIAAFVTLAVVWRRHPRAPVFAAVVGLYTAAGVAASHLAPHWSAFSDPYPDLHLDALSWAVMLAEIVAGLALGAVGLLRRRSANLEVAFGRP
jgi:hypothetical protein